MTKEVDALEQWLQVNAGDWTGRKSTTECKYRKKLDELVVQQPDGTVGLSIRFRTAAEEMAVQVLKKVSDLAEALAQQLQDFTSDAATSATSATSVALALGPGREAGKIRFQEDEIPISGMHMVKLRQLYEVHNGGQVSEEAFRHRMYCMLRRYVTFIGLDPAQQGSQGGNMHAAAPESVFAWLRDHMGVTCELFASPLNCYFAQYYSAFPDVDAFFGSRGSFFDVDDLPEGSYEVGPPYTEEVMELMARKLLRHLQSSEAQRRALSFVVFVPHWGDDCTALSLMGGGDFEAFRPSPCKSSESPYLLARGREHHYISGVQFFHDSGADARRRYYDVPHGTRIYVLQTSSGASKWPFDEAAARALLDKLSPAEQQKSWAARWNVLMPCGNVRPPLTNPLAILFTLNPGCSSQPYALLFL
ncbi:unnamed protein product [Cladocopium goreaui]|uniref:PCIF1 WW domain-containing protein n=1 Tax=Cladocopium goreaui TaxID=2562237 RepID=A0A9P1GJ30_9DINO|nr:unnamed protein product [Cladocopium goreaui]